MHHVRQENLPFVGSSHEFVGAQQGDTRCLFSFFMGNRVQGRARIAILMMKFSSSEGRGIWTVDGKTIEGSAGDIFVIKAGEVHSFKATGDSPLIQVDVHISPRFIQENL